MSENQEVLHAEGEADLFEMTDVRDLDSSAAVAHLSMHCITEECYACSTGVQEAE